jgi:membrane-bound lytic murein transglycosylase B
LKNKEEIDRLESMKRHIRIRETYYLISIISILLSPVAYGNDSIRIFLSYQPLIDRLYQDGFDSEFLSELYTDPRAEPISAVMTIPLHSNEFPERYARFLSPESILLSKNFLHQNLKTLRLMEKKFHVEKEIAVAILLVESRFGENIGKYRVAPTLSSMALMHSQENLLINYLSLWKIDPELSYEWMEGVAKRKAEWAYQELKCFLNIIRQEKIDPLEVYGSHAGAMGIAQFIPSSYLNYALRQKSLGDWLLSREEAIFSVGNYLGSHGWKKSLSVQKKKQILWYYNRSEPYVETVIKVSQKIKQ